MVLLLAVISRTRERYVEKPRRWVRRCLLDPPGPSEPPPQEGRPQAASRCVFLDNWLPTRDASACIPTSP